jgi:hypothetical protein
MSFEEACELIGSIDETGRILTRFAVQRIGTNTWGVLVRVSWDKFPRILENRNSLGDLLKEVERRGLQRDVRQNVAVVEDGQMMLF